MHKQMIVYTMFVCDSTQLFLMTVFLLKAKNSLTLIQIVNLYTFFTSIIFKLKDFISWLIWLDFSILRQNSRDGRTFLWDFAFRVPAFLEFPSRSTFPRSCTTLFSCSPELSRSYFAFLCFCSSPIGHKWRAVAS